MTVLIHHQRLFALNRNIVDGTFGRDIDLCRGGLRKSWFYIVKYMPDLHVLADISGHGKA